MQGTIFDNSATVKAQKTHPFGSTLEAIIYPLALLAAIWLIYYAEQLFTGIEWVRLGVYPRTLKGLIGVLFMPFIHAPNDISHIVNNSLPILFLTATLVYFYRDIALKVFFLGWLLTGLGVWIIAANHGSYHIGISGIIYALASFIFVSGYIRQYLPLQAMALFVAFVYGGMVWGVFPTSERISWEGHLSGAIVGILLAIWFSEKGPVAPKYQYEIEKEMGIEPPDLEGQYLEKMRLLDEQQKEKERIRSLNITAPVKVVYFYREVNPPRIDEEEKDSKE